MINTNYDRYKELIAQYKVKFISGAASEEINLDDYDVVIKYVGVGYAHTKYQVIKNGPNLLIQDLAIICDKGNLCFGYRTQGSTIIIHTD